MGVKGIEKRLDTLWATVVRLLSNNCCECCGKTTSLNSHHIFSRSNRQVRWDVDNGILLCVSHHIFGQFSAHKAPLEFAEWIKEKRGEEWYERLRKKSKSIVKVTIQNKEDLHKYLKEKLNAIKTN